MKMSDIALRLEHELAKEIAKSLDDVCEIVDGRLNKTTTIRLKLCDVYINMVECHDFYNNQPTATDSVHVQVSTTVDKVFDLNDPEVSPESTIWTSGRIRPESCGLENHTPVNSDEEERKESQDFDSAFTLGTVTPCSNAPAGPE